MQPMRAEFISALYLLASCSLANQLFAAQSAATNIADQYPSRPVRFIVPFPPGGSDTVARILAEELTVQTGQQFVIDNRPGAGSTIGTAIAAQGTNDGYTLLFATSAFAISAAVYRKLPYDPIRDFLPVSKVALAPLLLVAHPSVRASSVKELVALAKSKPGVLNYASNGSGSITFLAAEMLKSMADIKITEVTYKGAGPSIAALLSGEVQLMVAPLGPVIPHVRSGRLKALAVPRLNRLKIFPNLPTISESGIQGYEADNWYGLVVPSGTPSSIVRVLNRHSVTALGNSKVEKRLSALGYEAISSTPEQFGKYIKAEIAKWSSVISNAGIAPNP
jgi:tripartite-type tricarboxylate transporter receptor subunit TctC